MKYEICFHDDLDFDLQTAVLGLQMLKRCIQINLSLLVLVYLSTLDKPQDL